MTREVAGGALPAEHQLRWGDQVAGVRETGATLRRYAAGGRELVDGFPRRGWSQDGRGQLLLPWPNRVRDGRYRFGELEHQLPLSEPERGNAIHGLTRWLPWQAGRSESDRLLLTCQVQPQPGYPFWLELEADYRLGPGGLRVDIRAVNLGAVPAPFGAGAHPYLTLGDSPVDDLVLLLPAHSRLKTDLRGIPDGEPVAVEGSEYDFRSGRAVGSLRLDTAFTGLPGGEGWEASLEDPRAPGRLRLWADAAFGYVMAYTGDGVGDPARRRRGLALEPMTCAPDAYNNGLGLLTLPPGGSISASWGLVYER